VSPGQNGLISWWVSAAASSVGVLAHSGVPRAIAAQASLNHRQCVDRKPMSPFLFEDEVEQSRTRSIP
jgi:hypothetical protein